MFDGLSTIEIDIIALFVYDLSDGNFYTELIFEFSSFIYLVLNYLEAKKIDFLVEIDLDNKRSTRNK